MAESTMIGADTSSYPKPAAGQNMLTQAVQMGQLANLGLANQTGQFDLAKKQVDNMYGRLSALYGNPDLSEDDIIREGAGMMARGELNKDQFSTFMTTVAKVGPRKAVEGALMNTLQAQERLNAVAGQTAVSDGAGTQFLQRNQLTNRVSPSGGAGGYVRNKLSPGERAQPIPTFRNGQPGSTPLGTTVDDYGNARVSLPPAPMPGAGAGNMLPGNVAMPGVPAAPAAPAAPTVPNAAPQRGPVAVSEPPFNPTGPAVGQAESANRTAAASAEQGNQLQGLADGTQNRKSMLANMEQDLAKFESGPLADAVKQGKATVNQVGGYLGWKPFDEQSIAAQEAFGKQAQQLINEQWKALGGTGTDNQLSSALRANPNAALSKYGIQQIIQMLKGNEDAIAAKNAAWQQWKAANGADSYGQFASAFNKNFEPRAFQWVYMDPKQRQEMYNSMNPNERKQLAAAYNFAVQNGWIKSGQ